LEFISSKILSCNGGFNSAQNIKKIWDFSSARDWIITCKDLKSLLYGCNITIISKFIKFALRRNSCKKAFNASNWGW
jgi:hypothetical protein